MRRMMLFPMFLLTALAAYGADACDLKNLQGPYGFQLSGETTISGSPKRVASLGRIVLGDRASLSGSSTAMFAGFLLGNPVTGSYEIKTDCTFLWSLQDDSGGFQHFQGSIAPDGSRARFRQTDPGGAEEGILVRTSDGCSSANLRPQYHFTISGDFVPMVPGDSPDEMKIDGVVQSDDHGVFRLTPKDTSQPVVGVTIRVESDCIVNLEFALPSVAPVKLRGVMVDDGKQILAIRIDPGWIAPARLTAP